MIELYDGDFLEEDLALVTRMSSAEEADMINAFLNDVAGCVDAMWTLCRRDANFPHPAFTCKVVECFLKRGFNISRIRPLRGKLNRYRVIYAYDNSCDEIHLLAIVRKRVDPLPEGADPNTYYDYEARHPITARIEQEYDRLGIPRLDG